MATRVENRIKDLGRPRDIAQFKTKTENRIQNREMRMPRTLKDQLAANGQNNTAPASGVRKQYQRAFGNRKRSFNK